MTGRAIAIDTPRTLVVQAEQRHDADNIAGAIDRHTYPAGIGIDVMGLSAPLRDEVVTHQQRERQVRQPATVEVPKFSMTDAELGSTEPVPGRRDARP